MRGKWTSQAFLAFVSLAWPPVVHTARTPSPSVPIYLVHPYILAGDSLVAMAEIQTWYHGLPPVTKWFFSLSVGATLLGTLGVFPAEQAALILDSITKEFQVRSDTSLNSGACADWHLTQYNVSSFSDLLILFAASIGMEIGFNLHLPYAFTVFCHEHDVPVR